MVFAGGPYSNRAGAAHDNFADFVVLDAHQELALLCGTRFVFLLDVSRPKRRVQPSARI